MSINKTYTSVSSTSSFTQLTIILVQFIQNIIGKFNQTKNGKYAYMQEMQKK